MFNTKAIDELEKAGVITEVALTAECCRGPVTFQVITNGKPFQFRCSCGRVLYEKNMPKREAP